MLGPPLDDILGYYDRYFASGMVDLSTSSPLVAAFPGEASEMRQGLSYADRDGDSALRVAIAARYESIAADDVVVTTGASEALAALALALLRPGDTADIGSGGYPSFVETARAVGANFSPSLDVGDVRVSLTSNPTVPGGQVVELGSWIEQAVVSGAVPIVDEVYRELTLDGRCILAAADLDPRAVSVGDLSKPLGLGGLRIGWVASHDRELLARVRRRVQLLSGGAATPSVAIALSAFASFDTCVAHTLELARVSATATYAVLRTFGWRFAEAEAGLTVLAYPPRPVLPSALARLREKGLFLLPTEVFGFPGAFRISLLQPAELLETALTALSTPESFGPDTVILFTKAPAQGKAKSRLAISVGPETAVGFARAFIRDTSQLVEAGSWPTTVAYAPAGSEAELHDLAPADHYLQQPIGDLGARIRFAIEHELVRGHRPVLIGSDTPDLPACLLSQAFQTLDSTDFVIGPSPDGGFYLLGARTFDSRVFEGVMWSTPHVFQQLVENLQRAGYSFTLLEEWEDVDDIHSLRALEGRLAATSACPATREALRQWRGVMQRVG
ncbi:MAG: TIGR04282 family arsenosugar biosynthesis glycosyltransferase [Tepidiformaceae bacterium]